MLLLLLRNKLIPQCYSMVALLTLIVLLFPHTKALASDHNINQNPLKFERISIAEGLSQSYVYDITQDQNGFIWIATQDGLNRYDGKNFVYYRHDSTDKKSIADNFIRKIFIDNKNVLWVGTNEGLSRYNESLDNFDNFIHQKNDSNSLKDNEIWDIYQDPNNNIWVSTKEGLHKFDPEYQNFSRIRIRGLDAALKEIKTIFQDEKGNYWLGTFDKGIYLANNTLTFAISLSENNKWNLKLNANALYDLKFIDNHYWLATNNGLFVVSQDYEIKKHYSDDKENISERLLSNNVRTITLLDNSMVWLGTLNGLNIINLLSGNIDAYQTVQHKNAISNNYILKLFKDSADNIWLGTNGNGINTFNSLQLKIRHGLFNYDEIPSTVNAFAESKDGNIWFATDDGKLSYLNSMGKVTHLETGNTSPISHLMIDNSDNFWLRTEAERLTQAGNLYYFDTKALTLVENKFWTNNSSHTDYSQLFLIENKIWFLDSEMQLTTFDVKTNQFESFIPRNANQFTSLKYDYNKSEIWLSTKKGEILQFDISTSEFSDNLYLLSNRMTFGEISTIALSNKWIWLGSRHNGVALINKKDSTELYFNEKNGLSNNFIADIVIDSTEIGWLSTNIGINSIDPKSKLVKSFNKDMLISDNEYISDSSLLTSSDTIFFGGINGFHTFIPQEISQIKQKIPTPIISNILTQVSGFKIDEEITIT
ncbi:hypothetical protein H4J50_17570 [Colwellia sp. 6M3]|uniref:ligand-binding sensor domain-containing protein n=1 Tax=Colwellia sp. 6M3 TaxID=2759849 RepID=UPI0015F3966A|nr:two-component regulator propeller domain-containing protein [Colwellia sp. 6M3]MBA6417811.1 hypothetical protein [Colwellia sp. 6M3]